MPLLSPGNNVATEPSERSLLLAQEKQHLQHCLKHALNNLLQREAFSLQQLNKLTDSIGAKRTWILGNFDANVLAAALVLQNMVRVFEHFPWVSGQIAVLQGYHDSLYEDRYIKQQDIILSRVVSHHWVIQQRKLVRAYVLISAYLSRRSGASEFSVQHQRPELLCCQVINRTHIRHLCHANWSVAMPWL